MRGSHRRSTGFIAAGICVVLLAGFGDPRPRFSLVREVGDQLAAKGRAYREYRTVRDDSRALEVKAPRQWDEVGPTLSFVWFGGGDPFGAAAGVRVSTDLDSSPSSFDVPGFQLIATREAPASINEVLDAFSATYDRECTGSGVKAYDDGRYRGNYEFFASCAGTNTAAVAVAATSADDGLFVVVAAEVRTRADLAAVDRAIRSVKLR
jgi:hypothetical protein